MISKDESPPGPVVLHPAAGRVVELGDLRHADVRLYGHDRRRRASSPRAGRRTTQWRSSSRRWAAVAVSRTSASGSRSSRPADRRATRSTRARPPRSARVRNAGGAPAGVSQDFNQVICGNQTASGEGSNTATVKPARRCRGGLLERRQRGHRPEPVDSVTSRSAPGGPLRPIREPLPHPSRRLHGELRGRRRQRSREGDANTCSRIQQVAAVRPEQNHEAGPEKPALRVGRRGRLRVHRQGTFVGGIDSTQNQQSIRPVPTPRASSMSRPWIRSCRSRMRPASSIVTEDEDPRCCSVSRSEARRAPGRSSRT